MANTVTVLCKGCGFTCSRVGGISVHEQQAIESKPCHRCGAWTLSCSANGLSQRMALRQKRILNRNGI